MRFLPRFAALLPLVLMAVGCKCGGGGAAPETTARGRRLSPLPAAPEIQIAPGQLPSGELAVVAAQPTGTVRGDARPTLTFSKPIVALGDLELEGKRPAVAKIEPAVEGEWRWLGSASVELVPKKPLPYSTRFQVTVPAGLTALDGSKLAAPYSYEWQTPSPEIQRTVPQDGFAWLDAKPTLALVFDQPVEDLGKHARLLVGKEGKPVELRVAKTVSLAEERRAQRGEPNPYEGRTRFATRQTRYELEPVSPLPLDQPVVLVVDDSLRGAEGPLTLDQEARFQLRTYGPMAITGAVACGADLYCHYGPAILYTTNQADLASLKGKVSFEPAVEIDWEHAESSLPQSWSDDERPWVSLPGRFRPGTRYKVKVQPGVLDDHGQKAPGFSGEIATVDLDPNLVLGEEVALLEASGDGALPVDSVNVSSARAEVWVLDPGQLARLLTWDRWSQAPAPIPAQAPLALDLDLSAKRNSVKITPLPLRQALPAGKRTGFFLVSATSSDLPKRDPQRVVAQLTDLAVHTKLGPQSGAVWVTRLSNGQPVGGASLQLLDRAGELRWQGKSDADGVARVPGLAELLKEDGEPWAPPPAIVVAEKDGDAAATLSTWNEGIHPASFELETGYEGRRPASLGFVFADRGIYRPGDEVHLKGLARLRHLGEIRAPAAGSLAEVKVVGSRGEEVFKQKVPVSAFGSFGSRLTLGKEASLGNYEVSATIPDAGGELSLSGAFRVEEYRAPQFRVDLTAPANAVAGDALSATLLARYLFGGAMAGASVRWSTVQRSVVFEPPGNPGFRFGNHVWWLDDGEPMPTRAVAGGGELTTDAQGNGKLALGTAATPGGKTYEQTIEAEVEDVNRQRLANRAVITVHPASVYAGVRLAATGFAEVGKAARIEAIAASPDGKRQAGQRIAVEIKRREWKSIRKKGVGGEWLTVSEPVDTRVHGCDLKSEQTPVFCELTPSQPGLHVIEAKVKDSQGREQVTRDAFYVVGSGWVSWQRNDTERIDLVADKQLYDVGETAKILVKSPYPEAEAILTVEREGVFTARRVQLKGAATVLDVPLDESLVPNAFVGLVLVRGRVPTDKGIETGADPGRPAVRVGYTELRIEKKSKRLAVKLTPDAPTHRPGEKARIEVNVTDWKGAGHEAEVTVWAVDEGVLRLTNYEVPDPVEAIHPQRSLSVGIGEPLLHLVLARLYGEKGETAGGSGGQDSSGSGFRSRFKTTVLFETVVTDAAGHARVSFELPDNLTTFRLMAVAVTRGDLFGSGRSEVSVAKPLLALPALPRFANVGDKLEAGVVVHAHGATFNEVEVKAQAEGLVLSGPARKTVSLADGRPQEVRFSFEAPAAGTAKLRFSVQSGSERDGVEQTIPVLLPVSMEAVATYGDTNGKRTEGITPPGGVRPGVGGLELTLASTALGNFDEGMRQLVDYPYGCVEQLSSRLVPFIALRELYGTFGVPYQAPKADPARDAIREWISAPTLALHGTTDPDEVVRLTVKAIERLQAHDGSFRYWPSSTCSDPWSSAYATLALGRAKEVGYPVDAKALERAQRYLADSVAAGRCNQCEGACIKPGEATRVFALWTLARTGAPKPSYYGALFAARRKLPLFSQAMLADTLYVGKGDRAQARQVLDEVLNNAKVTAADVHFEETDPATHGALWSSDGRTTALVLQTLADLSPDHPFVSRISHYLVRARQPDGRFRNTQEAAFSLMALTEVVRTKEKQPPDFVGRVSLGGKELAAVAFRGRSMSVERVSLPIDQLAQGKGTQPLVLDRDGASGVLYYGALLRYAPAQMPTNALDRGIVVQRWLEPYEGGGQARAFFAGELVRVRVRIGTPMERNFVAVEVPLPAGLEAVDTSLASTARLPQSERDTEGPGEGYDYESEESPKPWAEVFYSPFNHVEMRDDRVVLFADRLPPGVHVATFVARATTPGDFILRPVQAAEMYAPEVFGRSDAGRLTVGVSTPVAGR